MAVHEARVVAAAVQGCIWGDAVCQIISPSQPWLGLAPWYRLPVPWLTLLQGADHWRVTAGPSLDIADILVAVLEPTGPPIRVDRGVCQNQ